MPKLLVLFDARSDDVARLAEAIAEGARGVRFAEVDVRRTPPSGTEPDVRHRGDEKPRLGSRHRALESADALAGYDAIVVGVESGAGQASDAVRALIETTEVNLANKVASAFTPEGPGGSAAERRAALASVLASVLTPMGERGMIIVPPRIADRGDDELHTARNQGKRVYDVTGWITHARSHHHH